ncbi:MAG TPA: hypothetical protein PKI11_09385 [Candidatus Hydrogenedentes bacterium]|nr:hypothetical protein [Candidatus Hydrogenedentota bacterium]HNT86685.1 hypothetical protein [Candidatus Hydrogenedentota bacterium]
MCAVGVLFLASFGGAQEPPARAPVPWLDWVAEGMAFALAEAAPTEEALDEAPPPAGDAATELTRIRHELREVRSELRYLRSTLDYYIEDVVSKLQDENAQLRAELQRIYALRGAAPDAVFPAVPRPSDDLVADVLSETIERMLDRPGSRPETASPDETAAPSASFSYTVIAEWGREPDEDAVARGEASSLKGMVCLVPRRSRRDDVIALGRELRRQFDGFDNINIEVFDEEHAARTFAETSVSSGPEHRVLSISKHRASGRDTIVYFEDGVAKEIPLETP